MSIEEYNEQKRVLKRRRVTRLRIGGEEDQPKSLWEWLMNLLINPFKLSIERETSEEIDLSERSSRIIPSEQCEEVTRATVRQVLEEEESNRERQLLESPDGGSVPTSSVDEEIERLQAELEQRVEKLQKSGWRLRRPNK